MQGCNVDRTSAAAPSLPKGILQAATFCQQLRWAAALWGYSRVPEAPSLWRSLSWVRTWSWLLLYQYGKDDTFSAHGEGTNAWSSTHIYASVLRVAVNNNTLPNALSSLLWLPLPQGPQEVHISSRSEVGGHLWRTWVTIPFSKLLTLC